MASTYDMVEERQTIKTTAEAILTTTTLHFIVARARIPQEEYRSVRIWYTGTTVDG